MHFFIVHLSVLFFRVYQFQGFCFDFEDRLFSQAMLVNMYGKDSWDVVLKNFTKKLSGIIHQNNLLLFFTSSVCFIFPPSHIPHTLHPAPHFTLPARFYIIPPRNFVGVSYNEPFGCSPLHTLPLLHKHVRHFFRPLSTNFLALILTLFVSIPLQKDIHILLHSSYQYCAKFHRFSPRSPQPVGS